MSRRSLRFEEDKTDINISPMIDMVFILLIFFIVTTVFVDERGLNVDKPIPNPNQRQDQKPDPFKLQIIETGDVLLNGENIGLSGVRERVKVRVAKKQSPITIEISPGIRSGLMIRVMDEIKLGGANDIAVSAMAN
jgi:biopolymer transport protein ExbD